MERFAKDDRRNQPIMNTDSLSRDRLRDEYKSCLGKLFSENENIICDLRIASCPVYNYEASSQVEQHSKSDFVTWGMDLCRQY